MSVCDKQLLNQIDLLSKYKLNKKKIVKIKLLKRFHFTREAAKSIPQVKADWFSNS